MRNQTEPVCSQNLDGSPAGATSMPTVTSVMPVVEETLTVSKRRVRTGSVRVSTRTESFDEVAEIVSDRSRVEVTRVSIGRVVEAVPDMRVEGDTTVVPVVEERLVVVKQLVLVEEVHIRRRVEKGIERRPVTVRRQYVVVERFDSTGRLIDDPHEACRHVNGSNSQGTNIMGILDSVLGGLLGSNSGPSSPMGTILSGMLGGGQQSGTASPGMGGALGGGLGGLISQFQNAGLGHVAQSWVGNGPNQPVTTDQLQNVFGHQQVNDMATQAGMQPGNFLSQLAQHLPAAVNGMTPSGQLPDEGSISV